MPERRGLFGGWTPSWGKPHTAREETLAVEEETNTQLSKPSLSQNPHPPKHINGLSAGCMWHMARPKTKVPGSVE